MTPTNTTSATWQDRARQLAGQLQTAGKLHDPHWHQAIREIPRHQLVPAFYQYSNGAQHLVTADTIGADGLLDKVYANIPLVTRLGPDGIVVSSSSQPGLMTRMLEALDIADGHQVLEIGLGTGYNTALLCHRLGSGHVYSIDVDPKLVEVARPRLVDLGYTPTLVAGDGADGLPGHAPFDRIIATCSVGRIPWAWVEQTRQGGLILADLKLSIGTGNLVLLRKTSSGKAEGRFDPVFASFMALRHSTTPTPESRQPRAEETTGRTTTHSATPWHNSVLWFLAALTMPCGLTYSYHGLRGGEPPTDLSDPSAMFATVGLSLPDGSWCDIDITGNGDGTRTVTEAGPTCIWHHIEQATELWRAVGEPGWDRLGLTVGPATQTVWLDHPDNEHRWELRKLKTARGPT